MKLDEIKEFHTKLGKLLKDPQEGLFTWHMCLHKLIVDFIKSWQYTPD